MDNKKTTSIDNSYNLFWDNLKKAPLNKPEVIDLFLTKENRSSTIFPIYISVDHDIYLSFFSYWPIKHGVNSLLKLSLRDNLGEILDIKYHPILEVGIKEINIKKEFNINMEEKSQLSLEAEVFTKEKPLYSFPALTIIYENENSLSAVHSCIRTYNLNEKINDYALNLPQAGFDILFSNENKNYFCFMGSNNDSYELNLTLLFNELVIDKKVTINNSCYGKVHTIIIEDVFDTNGFYGFATLRIEHNLDVFPRFYCGIQNKNNVPTLTHTFFDTSNETLKKAHLEGYGKFCENINSYDYFDSTFTIPIMPLSEYITELKTYGQNQSFEGKIHLYLKTYSGLTKQKLTLTEQEKNKWLSWNTFNITNFFKKNNIGYEKNEIQYLKIAFETDKNNFPVRFKMGLNISKIDNNLLGTNICFAPLVQNKRTIEKPFTRRWLPIGGSKNIIGTFHNTCLEKHPKKHISEVTLKIYNSDNKLLTRKYKIENDASLILDAKKDKELAGFLDNQIGWCLAQIDSYMLDAYFFSTIGDQIGGDHAF